MSSSVDDVVVGAALVGEALTVAVDLQEGLSAGVVLADGAGEGLAAESGVACHITAVHAGSHDAAIEQHGSSFLVEVCTGPDSGTDAVALIGRRVRAGGGDGGTQRVQLLHHVGVAGEAAAGQQHALVGVVADEVVILGALGDDAGDAASGVLLQLCQRGLEVNIVAQLTDVVQQQLVTGLARGRLAGHVVVLLHGEEVIGVVLGVLGRPCCLRAGSEIAGPAVLIFQNAAHEIVHCSRLIDPGLDNALVALAGSVAGDLAQQLGTVSGLFPCFLCGSRIDSAVPVTGILHVAVLLDDAEVQAVGGSIGGSEYTAVACTHDEDVGVHGLGDGSLVDVRLLAQPIVFVTGGQLDGDHSSLALGLSVTALGSLHDSVGSDGGAGNAVDLSRACSHQLLTQLVGSSSAVGSGLAGGIDHNVGHSAVGEGHGDLDGRRDALSSTLIGAGDVGACCTGSSRCGGGRAGSIAGSQSTGSHTRHGGCGSDLQKTFAGDLVHFAWFLSSCLFLLLYSFS